MLLALDTATPRVTVALHDGSDVVAEHVAEQGMRHGEQLAPAIEAVMREAGVVRQDLTAVAAGVGPGPFTGLRVGLVTARTLGFVLDVPVYGVCSLDVLAVEAVATGAVAAGVSEAAGEADQGFLVATDARRKEVYVAAYAADGTRADGPHVLRPADVADAAGRLVVGEGGALYPDVFTRATGPLRPSAGWLARVVAEELAELLDPEPLYLRRPDAVAPGARKPAS
ncbi:tRNA (adenosine(37)-N6)-threonylcarbamoyltransferase complex dimerization subunit type 1 TsaB [Nocardioides perillae]|uniref:tRNA threonylcarbamoyl adenosine modification protein YeaZ n=1 Tax=Nocardioides perillae TaxID=1119534 RepID=A0A7Y9RUV8_9ACTN|nr:tRNA threonylcarbamoyl adenosine modification protein YeaZ [Nocardioides perillae]